MQRLDSAFDHVGRIAELLSWARPAGIFRQRSAGRSSGYSMTTPLNVLIFPSATRMVPTGVPPAMISAAWSVPCTGANCQSKSLP